MARNRARRRPRRRRGGNSRLWIALLPVAALILWLVLSNHVFVVRNVEVAGAGSVSVQDVVRLSGIRLGGRLKAIDRSKVQTSVESTGRLAFVDVKAKYPTTVVLTVRERSQDALILQAGKVLVLDSDGYVVSVSDRLPETSMPYVTGLRPSYYQLGHRLDVRDGQLQAMKSVLEALKAQGATGYVSELSLEYVKDIRIVTRTGMTVLLGDAENMNNKVVWMAGALRDLESRGETLGRLDVSSGSKADFLSGATPTPVPTAVPTPEPTAEAGAEADDLGEAAALSGAI